MAYHEVTIQSYKYFNARYSNSSSELLDESYPNDAAYLATRNAESATTFIKDTTFLLIGQNCSYGEAGGTYRYSTHRTTLHFRNSLNIKAGAPIEYALLQIYKVDYAGRLSATYVVTNGQPEYPHIPPVSSDYNISNYSGNGGEIELSTGSGWKNILLNSTGRSWINFSGNAYDYPNDDFCRLCLQSKDDIDGISTGSHFNEPYIYINDAKLTIRITVSIPTVSTNSAINISYTEALLRGEIINNGYWMGSYGFEIKKGLEGEVKTQYGGSSSQLVSTYTDFAEELEEGTTYYYRAFCTNEAGTGYGEWIEFTTLSHIELTTNAATEISYEWAMGNGEITSGTNATERGFEIKVDFVGSIYWFLEYQFAGFEIEGGLASMPLIWTTNDFGEIGFYHVGEMIKTESEDGDFEEGEFSIILGHEKPGFPGEGEGYIWDRLFPCKTYEYRAYAVIDGETYYGEWVEFSTLCEGSGDNQDNQTGDDISDANPTEPIIPISPISPIVPIEPPFTYPPFVYEPDLSDYPDWDWSYPPWDYDLPEIPPWVDPEYPDLPPLPPWYLPELPEWDIPDYPPPTFIGDLYYRKPYTKKDLDELRKKCIIYNKNSVEFALVLRHNMNVLREFLNMMTDYLGTDEFNDFTDLVPPQNLKELYLDPIEPEGFRTIINGFINNTVNNNIAVNRNFKLLTDGLSDYETSEDASFREITSAMKRMDEDNPDVHRMKQIIDNLNQEVTANFSNIMYNLNVVRARLLS